MKTLLTLGFIFLLAGWFGMFFRVRRDHTGHPLAIYSNYIGPRLFGFKLSETSSFGLIRFYRRQYGLSIWLALWWMGLAMIVIAAISWSR